MDNKLAFNEGVEELPDGSAIITLDDIPPGLYYHMAISAERAYKDGIITKRDIKKAVPKGTTKRGRKAKICAYVVKLIKDYVYRSKADD